MPTTTTTTPADDTAMQALSDAGAICGECGDEPGDRNCPDCERCYRDYVAALRKAGWAPRAETLLQAVSVARTRADAAGLLGDSRGERAAEKVAERLQDMAREARTTA